MSILEPGDKVVMNDNYYVSEKNRGVVFTVLSEPWNLCGTDVVKISGLSGGYAADGLTKVDNQEVQNE